MAPDSISYQEDTRGEDEEAPAEFDTQRQYSLFLIDCCQSMLQPWTLPLYHDSDDEDEDDEAEAAASEAEKTFLGKVASTLSHTLRRRIFQFPNDMQAVCLYNVKKADNVYQYGGVNLMMEMGCPSSERIQRINSLVTDFERDIQSVDDTDADEALTLFHALSVCQNHLSQVATKAGRRSLVWITCRSSPFTTSSSAHDDSDDMMTKLQTKVMDLHKLHNAIELVPLANQGQALNLDVFFKRLSQKVEGKETIHILPQPTSLEKFTQMFEIAYNRPRVVDNLRLRLGGSTCEIALELYSFARERNIQPVVRLTNDGNKLVPSETRLVSMDTGAVIEDSSSLKKSIKIGSTVRAFSKEEQNEMRTFLQHGLYLVGFRSQETLPSWMHVGSPWLTRPDNKSIKESSLFYNCLLEEMIQQNKYGLALMQKRWTCRYVALWPHSAEDESYDKPAGIYILQLPFADEIRSVEDTWLMTLAKYQTKEEGESAVKEEEEDAVQRAAEKMVAAMSIQGFSPVDFPNPAIVFHNRVLETLALNEDDPPTQKMIPDDTQPPDEFEFPAISKRVERFKAAIWASEDEYDANVSPLKRSGAKRGRSGDNPEHQTLADIAEAKNNPQQLMAFKLEQLKGYCLANGLRKTGTKSQIVEAICNRIEA